MDIGTANEEQFTIQEFLTEQHQSEPTMIIASLNGDYVPQVSQDLALGIYGRQFYVVRIGFMKDASTNELFRSRILVGRTFGMRPS